MRTKLRHYTDKRGRFIATFERYGTKPSYRGGEITTLLFVNIETIDGVKITNHLWFTEGKQFLALGTLRRGDKITFNARAKEYTKGYFGHKAEETGEQWCSADYKLSNPTKIDKIKETVKQ